MKTKTLLAMGLCAAIGFFATQTRAAEHEHKEGEADAKIQVPDTLDGIWAEIHKHHHALAIWDLGKALPSKVPAEHKKHVENMVKKLSQIAADLDKSGDAGDQAKTEANLKKLDALLKEMEDMAGPGEPAPHKH